MAMKYSGDPRHAEADVPPTVIRSILNLVHKRGMSPERLCRGLGFEPDDLAAPGIRVSYRQTRLLVRRAQQMLGDPAMGLATGLAQTIVSWGLPGLGMLACGTLGEALAFCAEHQIDAGSLLIHKQFASGHLTIVEATPRFFDPDLEAYLVEESFASIVSIARYLVGPHFSPVRVELAYPKPKHAAAYASAFNCPVVFNTETSRLFSESRWLDCELPTHDRYTGHAVRASLVSLMPPPSERNDLLECVSTYLRAHLDEPRVLQDMAKHLNLSERTLRRRLTGLNVSYRALMDQARYERALALLKRTSLSIGEVALATGFGDARNFRRAFKRWAGVLPNEVRTQSAQ